MLSWETLTVLHRSTAWREAKCSGSSRAMVRFWILFVLPPVLHITNLLERAIKVDCGEILSQALVDLHWDGLLHLLVAKMCLPPWHLKLYLQSNFADGLTWIVTSMFLGSLISWSCRVGTWDSWRFVPPDQEGCSCAQTSREEPQG